jgi:hypothetical protein
MAVTLHRCPNPLKLTGHPCWRVQKALDETGIEYVVAKEPWLRSKREDTVAATGQQALPWIEFEDGSVYRAESKAMEKRIRSGRLFEGRDTATAQPSG